VGNVSRSDPHPMLKAGFIGAGDRAFLVHLPILRRLKDVEMAAVCEINPERLKRATEAYSFGSVYEDHLEMLEREELDIVYCVMHEQYLLQPALSVLRAGIHLFVEKPPGMNAGETRRLHDTAVEHDVFAAVCFQRRYSAVVQEAKRRLDEKGPVTLATATFNKQVLGKKSQEIPSTLWHDACHAVDLMRYMAGGTRTEVSVRRDTFGSQSRNFYMALVGFDNRATGCVFANRASGGRVFRAELHGVGLGCYLDLPETIEIYDDNEHEVLNGWELAGVAKEDTAEYDGHSAMHRHIIECALNGTTPITDLRDVVHTMRLVDMIEGQSGPGGEE